MEKKQNIFEKNQTMCSCGHLIGRHVNGIGCTWEDNAGKVCSCENQRKDFPGYKKSIPREQGIVYRKEDHLRKG